MIFHLFIISSAVQIYEFSYIHYHVRIVVMQMTLRLLAGTFNALTENVFHEPSYSSV